jgi:Mrp family chromosome partitioning ATPase
MIFRRTRSKEQSKQPIYSPPGAHKPTPASGGDTHILYDYIHHPTFKRLLNQVAQRQDEQRLKSIGIVSEHPQEGKTFLTAALALGYASFLQKRVLIIDTICENGEESYFIGKITAGEGGLSMKGGGSVEVITTHTIHQEIYLHHSHDPSNRQERPKNIGGYASIDFQLGEVILALSATYDMIFVDTCSLSKSAKSSFDPVVVSQQVDGIILVNSVRSLEKDTMSRLKTELSQSRIKIIGTIFNQGL